MLHFALELIEGEAGSQQRLEEFARAVRHGAEIALGAEMGAAAAALRVPAGWVGAEPPQTQHIANCKTVLDFVAFAPAKSSQ